MGRDKKNQPNIDNSDPIGFPNGRIKNNTGPGDGTAVNEAIYGDMHETFAKLMRLYGIPYNSLPDSETNGYQYVEALRALASKNDFILDINSVGGKLEVPVKISSMLVNEQIVCKAVVDKTTETEITGLAGVSRAVSFIGDFKSGEYVRLINTSSTVVLIRLVDSVNLDTAISELQYLKAATTAEEIAGLINTKATTPQSNALAFVERVNGAESSNSLAIASVRNGLLSKEDAQRIADFANPADFIKIESATDIQVNGWSNGQLENNFNFNYIDIFPPTGKNMSNLKGVTCSLAGLKHRRDENNKGNFWCKYRVEVGKIRVIAGIVDGSEAPKVNHMSIWI
ncbi:hypothetical protein [Tenacibaculum finnmarkense]|uniref:hypothetical protein n=1 Tax=Tenacibaculum finnmarkense TaxID=2781243 RepID=UPI00207AD845|nr:hypothetical protein [Tenacibaculum finnmarkense]MCM8906781.1 hypothetical protein [Tenacibaculum finnmarkense genomovar finnmarkense]